MRSWLAIALLGFASPMLQSAEPQAKSPASAGAPNVGERSREKGWFELRDGDRVVLLGGTFIERLQNSGLVETALIAAHPHKNITFRNLGWSGDTVWGDSRAVFGTRADGFKRLVSDVKLCQPTVLIICYGHNEAFAGEKGLPAFRDGLNQLLDALEPTGARIVLLGPYKQFNMGPPLPDPAKYNADLRKYNDVIGEVAKEREHTFLDLYDVFENEWNFLRDLLVARRDSSKAPVSMAAAYQQWAAKRTDNGIHLTDIAESELAYFLREQLCGVPRGWSILLDVSSKSLSAVGTTVTDVAIANDKISFVVRDRTVVPAMMRGDLIVRGTPHEYELRIDGESCCVGSRFDPSVFLVMSRELGIRGEQLRQAINQKNQLFFHRYRPQNETYLFLFRKHEQGNNAVEIPQFDPLIAEKEAEIAKLRQPVPQKFELIRVKE